MTTLVNSPRTTANYLKTIERENLAGGLGASHAQWPSTRSLLELDVSLTQGTTHSRNWKPTRGMLPSAWQKAFRQVVICTPLTSMKKLQARVEGYLQKAGLKDTVTMHIGSALDIIPNLQEKWDLVFIDADKGNYSNYYDAVIDRMRPGGLIIADNVLWSGKVS